MEIGIYTLGDVGTDPLTGKTISARQRIKEIIDAAKLADEAGLDIFGIGEHHRLDFAASSPAVLLAAIAQDTKNLKLTSTTSVLSTLDPVRLFEDFATLDLLSDGRAEIIAGRGAFIESFPLFGYSTDDYDELFEENLDLLLKLNRQEIVTWSGKYRSPLRDAEIAPRPAQEEIPVWLGVGGSPESAIRAGKFGVGMAMAILRGDPLRFKHLVDIYRKTGLEAGHSPESLKVGVTGHAFLAKSTEEAKDEFFPYYANYWSNQRGMTTKLSKGDYEEMTSPETALFVGSPQQIIEKILRQHELFGHTRFLAQMDIGGVPFQKVAKSIELLATEVAPVIKKATRN
ncbi:LLM class flavin-dependent oxidoreductase [Bacillus dakarensis]|uniref:LLM class flavin-dependent oxidoreductase n=1 Tax=Robertmurraya dakarensis TaxID=1926278 RepID=UPI0009808BEE|nr:LLM class flavin-dependent oxidoreductase [Bacillus dakarensis]